MNIKDIQTKSHKIAVSKGFYDRESLANHHLFFIETKLALIITEVAEAIEGVRAKGISSNLDEELADTIIRVCDLAEYLNIDLEKAIEDKTNINLDRPTRHNKRF